MTKDDLYTLLGVLPSAEDVVVRAAYKALAQRYHPDRWAGSPEDAHRRMSAINEAFRVLGDHSLRAEYDNARKQTTERQSFDDGSDQNADAFGAALAELEERWSIACSIYPDLRDIRSQLSKISTPLAFAYVTSILEFKSYLKRGEVAASLEREFLERYFGTEPRVLAYARHLILDGERNAARALNSFVDVLGNGVDPDLLIEKIDSDFGLTTPRAQKLSRERKQQRFKVLVRSLQGKGYFDDAKELGALLGFEINEIGGGLFSMPQVEVKSQTGEVQVFKNPGAFIDWARSNLCRGYIA